MSDVAFVDVSSQMSGVEFSTLYLARDLDGSRWRPRVICPTEGDLPARARAASIPVDIVPCTRFFSTSVRLGGRTYPNPFAWASNAASIWLTARKLSRHLGAQPPALVVTKGLLAHLYGGLAARRARVPCVWHIQDLVSDRAGSFYARLLALTANALAREIIVDAGTIARQLSTGVPGERIHVIWNGVDTREFSPEVDGSRVRAEWGAGEDELLVGVIARLTPWKGQRLLLEAFAQLAGESPRARVVLVGTPLFDTDAYERELHKRVEDLKLTGRVLFAGFRWDMPDVLAALDIVLHPALEKDSSPLAVVSAMAAGKPIICARVDGTAELFAEGSDGLLFAPGNVEELASKLRALLLDDELRRRLGRNARAKAARELSIEQFTLKCETVFERAIGPRQSAVRSSRSAASNL